MVVVSVVLCKCMHVAQISIDCMSILLRRPLSLSKMSLFEYRAVNPSKVEHCDVAHRFSAPLSPCVSAFHCVARRLFVRRSVAVISLSDVEIIDERRPFLSSTASRSEVPTPNSL